jgi:hypothetical protein
MQYGEDVRLTVARAGGHNMRFYKVFERRRKPYTYAIQTDNLGERKSRQIMMGAYFESVILKWEVLRNGQWVQGIDGSGWADQDTLDVTEENCIRVFEQFPDFWNDVVTFANKMSNYRVAQLEEEAKN